MFAPLLEAVRDQCRLGLRPLNVRPDCVEVTPDGRVYADNGQVAVSVFNIDMSPSEESGNAILGLSFAVAIGITVKQREVPVDRRGTELYTDIGSKNEISVEELAQRIIRVVHGQPRLITAANKNGSRLGIMYSEPLYLARSIGTPERKTYEHWNIQDDANGNVGYNEDDEEGLYLELVFQGAKCFQHALEFEPTLED